mmetsp:Transcript_8514/g.19593  ORF Transcript_8514/g.19593 Transcript_8514/m.19593 type:complete len:90 (+) Transcript_8514:1163-1432(+)
MARAGCPFPPQFNRELPSLLSLSPHLDLRLVQRGVVAKLRLHGQRAWPDATRESFASPRRAHVSSGHATTQPPDTAARSKRPSAQKPAQ